MERNKINPLDNLIDFPFCLAPMVGLSHVVLRDLVRRYMPEGCKTIWPTEMLNSRRLIHQHIGSTPETIKSIEDDNLVPQILANEERFIAGSIPKLEAWGASGIDINMGCPQTKALKHNYGVSLMGDPEYAHEVVKMAKKHSKLPLSVKLRAGKNNDHDFLLRFCAGLYASGADWLVLHPREPEQKRKGNADWSQIRLVKNKFQMPLIGNGDVQTWEDAIRMREETLCDSVMIGRALTARPWMLWQLGSKLGLPNPKNMKNLDVPLSGEEEAIEYGKALEFFIERSFHYFESDQATKKILFYLRVSHPWLNFGHYLTRKMAKAKTKEQMLEVCSHFFTKTGLQMTQRTELRY